MVNEDIIKNWGIPQSLKNKNIVFKFNIKDLNSNFKNDKLVNGLTCDCMGSKFCLFDIDNNKIIFTMDFIIFGLVKNISWPREKEIKLSCLCLNDFEMRGKHIPTFYLEKLIEFGLSNNINTFKLFPNPDDELFDNIDKRNTLNSKELKKFYISRFEKFGFKHSYSFDEEGNESQLIFKKS